MTATKILFVAIAVGAGVVGCFQAAANAGLSGKIGLGGAILVNSVIVMAGSLALWAGSGAPTNLLPTGTPWTLFLGGVFGFLVIVAAAFVFPKLGAAWAMAVMVLGQSAAALAIDRFGLLGMPTVPVSLSRLAGMALVIAGVVLLRSKPATDLG